MRFKDGSSLKFLSLAADVLKVTMEGADSSEVIDICKNHIPSTYAQHYLARLHKLGLLNYNRKDNRFKTTRKGMKFLQDYRKLQVQL
jgi:predicted transcriptional regulator